MRTRDVVWWLLRRFMKDAAMDVLTFCEVCGIVLWRMRRFYVFKNINEIFPGMWTEGIAFTSFLPARGASLERAPWLCSRGWLACALDVLEYYNDVTFFVFFSYAALSHAGVFCQWMFNAAIHCIPRHGSNDGTRVLCQCCKPVQVRCDFKRYGLVAMPSAEHAEGLGFDPGYLYIKITFRSTKNHDGADPIEWTHRNTRTHKSDVSVVYC